MSDCKELRGSNIFQQGNIVGMHQRCRLHKNVIKASANKENDIDKNSIVNQEYRYTYGDIEIFFKLAAVQNVQVSLIIHFREGTKK